MTVGEVDPERERERDLFLPLDFCFLTFDGFCSSSSLLPSSLELPLLPLVWAAPESEENGWMGGEVEERGGERGRKVL